MIDLPKTWQPRFEPWVPDSPKTLMDCPEELRIAGCHGIPGNVQSVVFRRGTLAYWARGDGGEINYGRAIDWLFVRYLDQPSIKQPLIKDVPDGRCIRQPSDTSYYWRDAGNWFEYIPGGGWIRSAARAANFTEFTVTDIIMEFK